MKNRLYARKTLFLLIALPLAAALLLLPLISFAEGRSEQVQPPLSLSETEAPSAPEIRMASIYSNGMVLQRDKEIHICGTLLRDGVTLSATLGESSAEAVVTDGKWELVFPAMPASHALTLMITASDADIPAKTVTDIEVGEVWLACGQSNMQLGLARISDAEEYLNNAADYTNLRIFFRGQSAAMEESEPTAGKWSKTSDLNAVKKISAIGYIFVSELADAMPDVTIAIVDANYAGTSIYSWLNLETLKNDYPSYYSTYQTRYAEYLNGQTIEEVRHVPSGCYNAEIAPLAGITCRGILWYQGESDSWNPEGYERAFASFVSLYRSFFRNDDLAFYTFQLAPYPADAFARFRIAQYDMAARMENVHLIATCFNGPTYSRVDNIASSTSHIHPTSKSEPAIHCAREALAEEYGIGTDTVYKAPVLESVTSSGKTVTLTFDTDLKLLFGTKPSGFSILNGSTRFETSAVLDGNRIILTSDCQNPTGVLYSEAQMQIECKDGTVLKNITQDTTDTFQTTVTIVHGAGTAVFQAGINEPTRITSDGNVTNQSGAALPSFCVSLNGESCLMP